MPIAEPFIRHTRDDVIRMMAAALPEGQRRSFIKFSNMLMAWYHHSFHHQLELLKTDYQELRRARVVDHAVAARFARGLDATASAANFTQISRADLDKSLAEESIFRLRLFVDFADFSEIVFYRRGESQRTSRVASFFGLRKIEIEFTNYENVLVFIRFQPASHFADIEGLTFVPGSVVLKLFENVPKADLEMLFPNTRIRMRLTDKLVIGIPAFFSGLVVLTTKVGASLLLGGAIVGFWLGLRAEPVNIDEAGLIALVSGAGALGAYLWKQFNSFKNRKIRFMKALAESLYFKNLDNHNGVLAHLIDHAEESECKEVLLAYGELVAAGPMTAEGLCQAVERRLGAGTAFDIDDALRKLSELSLVSVVGDQMQPLPLHAAIADLDSKWDAIFEP
jgi:hypothetical protein